MSGDVLTAAAIIGLVVLATGLQRLTGIGFAMMLAPFLVVMLGPHSGVILTNLLSIFAPAMIIPTVWHQIQWRRLVIIAPVAAAVMPFFGWLAAVSPQGPLYLVVGSVVLLGLSASVIVSRISTTIDGPVPRALTGAGVGSGIVLAGAGGPAITIYALISRWDIRGFAATMQPFWVLMSIAALLTKVGFSGHETPMFPWWFWVGCLAAIGAGMQAAAAVRGRINDQVARRTVILLAFVGAGLSLFMGLREALG